MLRKELRSLAVAPFTWAVATAFLVVSGLFFVSLLLSYPLPDLERYYSNIETTFIVVAPIVAMRSFAEERRTGVLEVSLAWPVSRSTLVVGKYLANTLFTWLLASVAWLYVALLAQLGPVHVAVTAAGYLGVLLLIAMFNAVALAVSARSSSPATAAFVGFGVLLGLWILDFVPGWLGGRFHDIVTNLAPTTHLEASGRGLLDVGDGLYFVTGIAIGLTLALLALPEPRKPGLRAFISRRYLAPLVGIILTVGIGAWAALATGQLDLTPEHAFTLTRQSKAVLAAVKQPVHVYGIVQPGSAEQVQIQTLVRTYQAQHGDISVEFVDPDGQPAKTRSLGATTYGQMVVEIQGRREVLNNLGEVDLTSAIRRLARVKPPLACFTVGHGENSIDDKQGGGYSRLAVEIRKLGYGTKSLALGADGGAEQLSTCAVVIVAGPRAPMDPNELTLLQTFAKSQGRLIVLAATIAPDGVTEQLNRLLQPWGLTIGSSTVEDRSSLIKDPGSIIAFDYPSSSPVTNALRLERIPVLMVGARPVESVLLGEAASSEAWLVPLVKSSSRSHDNAGASGPYVLAALTDWSKVQDSSSGPAIARTRIGVVGTAEVASNQFIDRFGNLTFSTDLVSWVAIENDIIAAMRDPQGVVKLAITEDDRGRLIRNGIVFPALFGAVGFVGTLIRGRRG